MKTLLLIRGLPGSGKSTLADLLSKKCGAACFSIDAFFTDPINGTYHFDYKNNHLAYKACEANTLAELKKGSDLVMVEHTFTLEWEMEPYFKMAHECGYRVSVITVENRHGGKNIHQISTEQVEKMAAKYKVILC